MNSRFKSARVERKADSAFNLTELLVVIATLAILAMFVLPALAGFQVKSGRMQCANNLRQIGIASMIYANEYDTWLPICSVGGANSYPTKINNMAGLYYACYTFQGVPNSLVPTNAPSSQYQNLGYLYRLGLAGNGQMFYCPDNWGDFNGANYYSPLLTGDSGGTVRSSYIYNPRLINPANGNIARRYQKTSQLESHKLFAVDFIGSNYPYKNTYGASISHAREYGWNVLFTDGSVQFSRNVAAAAIIQATSFDETVGAALQADTAFNYLELDH